jgi:hypothetical protein
MPFQLANPYDIAFTLALVTQWPLIARIASFDPKTLNLHQLGDAWSRIPSRVALPRTAPEPQVDGRRTPRETAVARAFWRWALRPDAFRDDGVNRDQRAPLYTVQGIQGQCVT